MCGLFGFAGKEPDPELVYKIAMMASTRGPHAYGVARLEAGNILIEKKIGTLHDDPAFLKPLTSSFIGLCRLATSGTWKDPKNNQPLLLEDTALVHNGNVYNVSDIYRELQYKPETDCDSEAILVLFHHFPGDLSFKLFNAVATVDYRSPLAVLLLNRHYLLAERRGHPLYLLKTNEGHYFCSRKFDDDCWLVVQEDPYICLNV